MKDMKKIEIWDKWRPLIPPKHHPEWDHLNKEPVNEIRKKVQGQKDAGRATRKARTSAKD